MNVLQSCLWKANFLVLYSQRLDKEDNIFKLKLTTFLPTGWDHAKFSWNSLAPYFMHILNIMKKNRGDTL